MEYFERRDKPGLLGAAGRLASVDQSDWDACRRVSINRGEMLVGACGRRIVGFVFCGEVKSDAFYECFDEDERCLCTVVKRSRMLANVLR